MATTSTLIPQVNSATGIMGVTGSGKSSLLATLAMYVWLRYRKVSLFYTSDGGGFPSEVQKAQALGIMRVFRMRTRDTAEGDLAFETCYRAAQGWWPRLINPKTGEVPPGVEMVPPLVLRFEMKCPQGHTVKVVPAESLLIPGLCPQCRTMVTKQTMLVSKTLTPNKGFEDVGACFFDGLTSMLSWEMQELGRRAGKLELKGEEGAIGGKVVSGQLKFGGTTRSHVGFAQTRGEELVHLALSIPNLVVPPIFTMLTHEDVDERSLSILGPKIAGRAKTDEAPQWFGNLLEAAKVPSTTGSGEQRTLYLSEFTDDRNVRHLCKHRGSPGTMPDKLQDDPRGETDPAFAFQQFNLGVFFQMLDAALIKSVDEARIAYPDAPGVTDGWVEIGDMTIDAPPAAAAPPGPQVLTPAATIQPVAPAPTATVPAAPAPSAAAAPAPRKRTTKAAGASAPAAPPVAVPIQPAAPTPVVEAPAPAANQVEQPETPGAVAAAPQPSAAPVPVAPPAPVAPVAQAAPVAAPAPPTSAPRPMAPPAGRRPQGGGPAAPVRPVATAAPVPPPVGTPPGTVTGPAAPRPAAAAPRPPAAAPRPPAPAPKPH